MRIRSALRRRPLSSFTSSPSQALGENKLPISEIFLRMEGREAAT